MCTGTLIATLTLREVVFHSPLQTQSLGLTDGEAMNMVQYHPDGWIIVNAGNRYYRDTPENVYKDYGVTVEALPQSVTDSIYEPGKRHAFNANGDTIAGGPMPWPFGDELIARIGEGLAAQKTRKEIEDAADQAKLNAEMAEMMKKARAKP
jgi:hypothetical protein